MAEHVIEIDATPEEVWRVWTDVEAWPQWNSAVRTARRLDPGAFGRGGAARVQQPQLPAAVWRVVEWEPPTRWVWVAAQTGMTTTATHVVEDLGAGRCRVTAGVVHSGPLSGLVGRISRRLTTTLVVREVTDLKARCEGGVQPAPRHPPEGFRH